MNAQPLTVRVAPEALGTFLFFFLGFNAVAVAIDLPGGSISSVGVAFAFGLGLTPAVTALGHVCIAFVPRARSKGWPTSIRTAPARRGIVASRVD